jgi:DNA-binding LytR/AlgR family response regulator
VEIAWAPRTLLHRATLAGVAQELGDGFVQIHRSRLVRRAAIRRIETDRSGDFTVVLEDGTELKGSRRYRESVQG